MRHALAVGMLTVVLAATVTDGLEAQGRRGNDRAAAPAGSGVSVTVGFSATERDIIVKYYTANKYKAKRLPPGIAKNLARGKPLPPGIAKQVAPAALLAQLPRRPGFEVTIFGDRIVLLEAKGVVVDVLVDVFRN